MNVPVLETERLIMREWRESDFPAYYECCADEETQRYVGGKVMSRVEAWRHMAYVVGHWELRGFGHWAVEEKATGEFVGRVGVQDPDGWPEFEIGWMIAPSRRRRGYALEAARRALDYAFETIGRDHVISLIQAPNVASIAVATRLGETLEGETTVLGLPAQIYGITRERWRATRDGA